MLLNRFRSYSVSDVVLVSVSLEGCGGCRLACAVFNIMDGGRTRTKRRQQASEQLQTFERLGWTIVCACLPRKGSETGLLLGS